MAYNSKNMLKSKEFWIGFLVAVVVFVGLGELQRGSNRAAALSDLNAKWATLKGDSQKDIALTWATSVMFQNKSWFDFSNSSADEGDGEGDGEKRPREYGMEFWNRVSPVVPSVMTGWGWFNPDTGAWVEGR
ncbi:MAG: hypothetical protein KBC81_02300 [Candidatus Pacebacteria bacterium]|nr:hypothetical protein [Candidatus Paceibacterota bacterium]